MYTPPPAAPPAQNAPPAPSSAAKGPSRSGALKDPLGDRMKEYEGMEDRRLLPRVPILVRLDGRAFHSLTRSSVIPFVQDLHLVTAPVREALLFPSVGAGRPVVGAERPLVGGI